MIKSSLWALSILFSAPLSAALFHVIDTTSPLECRFSSSQHNRVVVSGGRIRKVICPEVEISIRMEEESGQVFVHALPHTPDSVTLSVISDRGVVQDLIVSFDDRSSEVVILENSSDRGENMLSSGVSSPQFISELANQIFAGQLPAGYRYLSVTPSRQRLASGACAQLIGKLEGGDDYLLIYRIANSNRRRWLGASEQELSCLGSQWVCLEGEWVPPCGALLGIVSVRKP